MQCNNMFLMMYSHSALSTVEPDNILYRGRNMWLLALAISATNIFTFVF